MKRKYSKKPTFKGFGSAPVQNPVHALIDEMFAAANSFTAYLEANSEWECTGGGMFMGPDGPVEMFRDVELRHRETGEFVDLRVGVRPIIVDLGEDCPTDLCVLAGVWESTQEKGVAQ